MKTDNTGTKRKNTTHEQNINRQQKDIHQTDNTRTRDIRQHTDIKGQTPNR